MPASVRNYWEFATTEVDHFHSLSIIVTGGSVMYEIKAHWAGYVLREQQAPDISGVEEVIKSLKETFAEGMSHYIYGMEVQIKTLCIDVLQEGELILQTDFKS